MFAGLFVNQWTFIALFTLIMFGCLYEFSKILKLINGEKFIFYLPIAFVYIILPILLMIDLGINGAHYLNYKDKLNPAEAGYTALLPCAVIFSIWINDTMAYIVGSMIGKTPFSKISPKKTWEGTVGGIILAVIVMGLIASVLVPINANAIWYILAAIAAVAGTVGDLLESKLKRMANFKDSGHIMPGHGGFLDRFDAFIFAVPFAAAYILLIR
jgi:phosphatidate cytidylyltransferase